MTDEPELAPASTEPAFGRASLERDAGYVPYKDESKEEAPSDLTTREAAEERLRQLSGDESKITTFTTGLPRNVTLTTDDAAKMLAESRAADEDQAALGDTKAQQKEVDKLRGGPPEAKAEPQAETEIDIDRALASPKIRAAVDERVSAAESQRAQYEAATTHATNFAVASFFGDFPELANLEPQNWESVVRSLPPARGQLLAAKFNALGQVEAANRHLAEQRTARDKSEFQSYAAKEDARFAEMTKGESDMPAIEREIVAMVREHGEDPAQFLKIGNESKFLRSATAQKILVDAAKYRMMVRTAKAVAHRDLPTVQRPGSSEPTTANTRGATNLQALSAKLSRSGSIKDAVALRVARQRR